MKLISLVVNPNVENSSRLIRCALRTRTGWRLPRMENTRTLMHIRSLYALLSSCVTGIADAIDNAIRGKLEAPS